jgi:hypothetical protein
MLYTLGTPNVAVIELSVEAGLMTLFFVFAINMQEKRTEICPR